jgi:hypothetical protein
VALSASGFALDSFATTGASSAAINLSASFRSPGGAFGNPSVLASGASDSADAIDDAGDGLVSFDQGSSGPAGAQVSGFDATPPAIISASIPSTATAGVPVPFSATAADFWGPVTVSWTFGDGSAATGGSVTHAFASAGTFTVTVTAADAAGNTVARSGSVVVSAAPGNHGQPGSHAPVLSHVSQAHSTFRVGRNPTAINARRAKPRPPIGTTFLFSLDQPAQVSIVVARELPGRVAGRRCVPSTKKLAQHRRCVRVVRAGVLTRAGHVGANAVAFSGRIGRRALPVGQYEVTITATASGLKSLPRTLRFTIVR